MAISNYKAITDGVGTTENLYTDTLPVGAAIANRLVNNTQFIAQSRLAKQSKSWDCTVVDDESLSTFSGSSSDPSAFVGYSGSVGGTTQSDVETVGFQFSTHPSMPLAIPFGWRLSPGAREIKVRVALQVMAATGSMYAFVSTETGADYPTAGTFTPGTSTRFNLPTGNNFFTTEIRAENSYAEMGPTSLSGTNGLSYYELTIEIPRGASGAFYESQFQNATILLCFQSGYDNVTYDSTAVATTSPALTTGNRVLRTTRDMGSYLGIKNPGKFHKIVNLTYFGDVDRTDSWHQVVQLRPADPTTAPFDQLNPEALVLWPAIPPEVVPPSLVGGAGSNSAAPEGSGLLAGATIDVYSVAQFNLFSVSIEENY
jgi:hypothetical protein